MLCVCYAIIRHRSEPDLSLENDLYVVPGLYLSLSIVNVCVFTII